MTYLRREDDWAKALVRLREKIRTARSRLSSMEIKNMVSHMAFDEEGTCSPLIFAARICTLQGPESTSAQGEGETHS
jgi:hypothetical protein